MARHPATRSLVPVRGAQPRRPRGKPRPRPTRLRTLRDLLARLTHPSALNDLLEALLAAALSVTGARGAAVFVHGNGKPKRAASAGETEDPAAARIAFPIRAAGGAAGELVVFSAALRPAFARKKEGRTKQRLPLPPGDWRFLEAIGSIAGAAIERARLLGELARVRDDERARLARELHDGAAQAIGAAKLEVERIALRHPEVELAPVLDRLQGVFGDLRALARALSPPLLETLGFRGALRRLADDLARRAETRATYVERGTPRPLPPEVEWHLYRIAEEAIANIARHACATRATIEISYLDDGVALLVEDDGRGFIVPEDRKLEAAPTGMGLLTIGDRSRALGAKLAIGSRPGAGTRIEVRVVLKRADPAATGRPAPSGGAPV